MAPRTDKVVVVGSFRRAFAGLLAAEFGDVVEADVVEVGAVGDVGQKLVVDAHAVASAAGGEVFEVLEAFDVAARRRHDLEARSEDWRGKAIPERRSGGCFFYCVRSNC